LENAPSDLSTHAYPAFIVRFQLTNAMQKGAFSVAISGYKCSFLSL
jgi:hypothetical protein